MHHLISDCSTNNYSASRLFLLFIVWVISFLVGSAVAWAMQKSSVFFVRGFFYSHHNFLLSYLSILLVPFLSYGIVRSGKYTLIYLLVFIKGAVFSFTCVSFSFFGRCAGPLLIVMGLFPQYIILSTNMMYWIYILTGNMIRPSRFLGLISLSSLICLCLQGAFINPFYYRLFKLL